MSDQPEALRLAEELGVSFQHDFHVVCEEAAAELRRLYKEVAALRAENERLREALTVAVKAEREACAIAGGAAAMAGLDHLQVAAAIRARGET